jgi:hypothetical protein
MPSNIDETDNHMDLATLNLKPLNLLIFPNWNQPEESLYLELELIIRSLVSHPDRDFLTLLIEVSETLENSELDASLIVSGIVMNLLMEEDLDINGEPEIILLENLNRSQWSDIWPQIQYRIKLNAENHRAIAESGTAQIPVLEQEQLSDITLDSQALILREFGNTLYRQARYEAAIKHYKR